jgi:hypothetical protein
MDPPSSTQVRTLSLMLATVMWTNGSSGGLRASVGGFTVSRMSSPEGGKLAQILTIALFVLGGLGILISIPVLGLAALGSIGALADAGPAENRKMALQLVSWGLPPFLGGVVLCGFGFVVFARNRKRGGSKRDALAGGLPTVRK